MNYGFEKLVLMGLPTILSFDQNVKRCFGFERFFLCGFAAW